MHLNHEDALYGSLLQASSQRPDFAYLLAALFQRLQLRLFVMHMKLVISKHRTTPANSRLHLNPSKGRRILGQFNSQRVRARTHCVFLFALLLQTYCRLREDS